MIEKEKERQMEVKKKGENCQMEVEENGKQWKYDFEKLNLENEMKEKELEWQHKLDVKWTKIDAKQQKSRIQAQETVLLEKIKIDNLRI